MQTNMYQFWEQYEAVLFDCDDTLTMSMQVRIKAILHMADHLQVSLNEKKIRAAWGYHLMYL